MKKIKEVFRFSPDTPIYFKSEDEGYHEISRPTNFKRLQNETLRKTIDINSQFQNLLQASGVTDKKQLEEMMQYSKHHKEQLLNLHAIQVQTEDETKPEKLIDALKMSPDMETFTVLVVCLRTKMMTWMEQFLNLGGLDLLSSVLASESDNCKQSNFENLDVLEHCVLCFRAIINCEIGMKRFLHTPDAVRSLALALYALKVEEEHKTQIVRIRCQILFLLCVVCHYSEEGFWLVLDAMNHFKLVKRFENDYNDC